MRSFALDSVCSAMMADPSVSEQQPPPPHYPRLKLTYINGVRARAESIRLMFAHKSIPYEQELIEKADMPSYKEKLLFNQLPMLQVDGREIVQSGSICRYVAKIAGLVPEDLVEAAQCDSVFEFGMVRRS